ncbi:hypothetical protein ACFT7S_14345 [Streptomyces sp. NPDC057136]|uniref:hypothetical protein n=1 Tax=Streptomyces sp. NPDC057136 TaxID=3346029 RepID=UPI003631AD72
MRRQTFGSTGRRGTVIAASAAVLCLGGAVAACGGGAGDDGYVAVGAAGTGPAETPRAAGLPSDKVTLIPLDTPGAERDGDGGGGHGENADEPGPGAELPGVPDGVPEAGERTATTGPGSGSGTSGSGGSGTAAPGSAGGTGSADPGSAGGTGSADPGSTGGSGGTGSTPPPSSSPAPTAPATPAALQVGDPVPAEADRRWCEKVTVEFRNTGGSPVRSGTVTFETHIIGALGIDWATVESTQPLPAPIDAGAVRKKTYTVCVESWRVPLGMRTETQDVTATWK